MWCSYPAMLSRWWCFLFLFLLFWIFFFSPKRFQTNQSFILYVLQRKPSLACAFICLPHEGSIISLRPTFSFPQVIDLNAVLIKCLCNVCKNMDCRLSFSSLLHVPLKRFLDHKLQLLHCTEFTLQGLEEGEDGGLYLWFAEPVPASSKSGPASGQSCVHCSSVMTYVRKGKTCCAAAVRRKGVRKKREMISCIDSKVSEGGRCSRCWCRNVCAACGKAGCCLGAHNLTVALREDANFERPPAWRLLAGTTACGRPKLEHSVPDGMYLHGNLCWSSSWRTVYHWNRRNVWEGRSSRKELLQAGHEPFSQF